MKSKVITLDVLQEFKNRFKEIVVKESTSKIPEIEISIGNINKDFTELKSDLKNYSDESTAKITAVSEAVSNVDKRMPKLSADGNSIIFDNNASFTHQSLEGYINQENIEETVANKGFSKLTIDTVKADDSFSQLIANKDKYLTQHLTKDEVEALNLDYNKLSQKPVIPGDIKDLKDSSNLILTMDNIKADDDLSDLIKNKSEFALKTSIPKKVSDLANDLNFTNITLSDIKADPDLNQLIINKDTYLTQQLTKQDIENLGLDYNKLSSRPTIPSDIKDLYDSDKLLLTLDNVKNDDDFNSLLMNKDNFALKSNLPSKLSDLVNDTNFSTLTLEDVKKDKDISNLVSNKDKFITSQLTKDDIEAMGLSYISLQNTPVIPNKVSQLTNDSGFTTFDGNYSSLSGKPSNLSDFTNDIVTIKDGIISVGDLTIKPLTEHQKLDDYQLKADAFNGDYASLKNKPELFTGNYDDLSGKPSIPSKLSELANDAGYSKFDGNYSSLADKPELFTGDYNDLVNLPVIPQDISELKDAKKLILNLDNVKSDPQLKELIDNKDKYAQKSSIPSKLSDLDNDTNFTTLSAVKTDADLAHKTDIVTSYLQLKDKPSIPSDISDLDDTNNLILTISKIKEDSAFAQLITDKDKYLTEHQDITHLADKKDIVKSYNDLLDTPYIPAKLSDLTNDSNYQTAADVELSISGKGYKTENDINLIISGKGFQTASDFINTLKEKGILNSSGNLSISCDNITGLGLLAKKDNLSAQDVGARPDTWTPTAQEVGVPEWARAANKPTYSASEVGVPS